MSIALPGYLGDEGSQEDDAEDGVFENPPEHVSLSMDLPCVDLIEDLHEYKRVEHYGVVYRGRGVEGGVSATGNVEQNLTCEREGQSN